MISPDLFGGFDPALVARIQAGNAQHKVEQACVTRSRELFDSYREFFDGLKSIDRDSAQGSNVLPFLRPRVVSEGD